MQVEIRLVSKYYPDHYYHLLVWTIVILLLFSHVHFHMARFPVNFLFKMRNIADSDCSKITSKDSVNMGYGSHMVFTPLGMRKERSVIGDLAHIKALWWTI